MKDFAPEGFELRHPKAGKQIKRSPLHAVGPDDEWSMDGHDKLLEAGFGIYGIRDKWSSIPHSYSCVPSNRYASVIGLLVLRCVKKVGGIPVQGSSDKGSEVRDAYALLLSLREHSEPDLLQALIPGWQFLPSPRNITIERSWRPLFHVWGVNILEFYNTGRFSVFFEAGNDIHRQTSNWIWFPLVQRELDKYCLQQCHHRVRRQTDKSLPSGGTPAEFYKHPEDYGGESCLIRVNEEILDQLLEQWEEEAREHMRYVDEDFEPVAEAAYEAIGKPEITLQSAWVVFRAMVEAMN